LRYLIITVLLLCSHWSSTGQEKPHTSLVNVEGQLSVTANGDAAFLSVGGAILKFNFPKFTVGIITMPVIKFCDEPGKPFITPGFGAGPQLYFLKDRRFMISAPFYYNNVKNEWQFTAGVGYVFSKPKRN
jgi:hypothetical protein